MSLGARTKNLHSQLIRSNGSGSFGGQGGPDFFLLTLQKPKHTHTHTHTLLQEIWNEANCKAKEAKQRKMTKLRQTSSKEKRAAAANKQSKASKQEKREFFGVWPKIELPLVQGQLQHMSIK
jgi:hypothetical protein